MKRAAHRPGPARRTRRLLALVAVVITALALDAVGGSGGRAPVQPSTGDQAAPQRREGARTRPLGARPLSDARAAARVRRSRWEPRPENAAANHRIPSAAELRSFYRAQARLDKWNRLTYARRVTGRFRGTTDEIIQWAAWKWGVNEDLIRAAAVVESYWRQNAVGGSGPYSHGLLQVEDTYAGTYPLSRLSTAFNADFYTAVVRHHFDGRNRWFNKVPHGRRYEAGDIWGAVGAWYAGEWYTPRARRYIRYVRRALTDLSWKDLGP